MRKRYIPQYDKKTVDEILSRLIKIDKTGLLGNPLREIFNKAFAIFGVGGNGTHVALALVLSGAKKVYLVDKDVVEYSNLTRQVLYSLESVGKPKAFEALQFLKHRSFITEIEVYYIDAVEKKDISEEIVKKSDFIFNLVDNVPTQFYISSLSLKYGKPMIYGGTEPVTGLVITLFFQEKDGKPVITVYIRFGKKGIRRPG